MLESRVKKEKAQTFALIIYLLLHARHTHTCPARAQTCSRSEGFLTTQSSV